MAHSTPPTHRIARAIDGMRGGVGGLAGAPVWSMTGAEAAEAVVEVARLEAQLAELKLRLLGQVGATGHPKETGHATTASWYAATTRVTRAQAHRETRLAAELAEHEPTRAALAQGAIHADQAAVVIKAISSLPQGLDPELVDRAEVMLVDQATRFDARALRILGNHTIEVIAPEIAEAHTAKLLEAEERAGQAAQSLVMHLDNLGRWQGRFTLDKLRGAALRKALLAIAAPKHQAASGPLAEHGERKPSPERMGAAFAEYVDRYPTDQLPETGGLNATVVVTMTLEALQGGLQAANLDTGEEISAAAARRLACEAAIIPAVRVGPSQVLDLGRTRRYHSRAQRIAIGLRQATCRAQGCDWPPGLCHVHHTKPWSQGGHTRHDEADLLCPHHHTRVHDPTYTTVRLPDGRIAFHRRP